MAYCTKCGRKLRDGDRFCYCCGTPVRDESGDTTEDSVKKDDRKKFSNKQIAGGIAAAAALIIVICFFIWNGKKELRYITYSNDTVCFSLDYPKGYMVTEPEDNNVLITNDGDADFQISAEYVFYTTTNSFIYSAKDFAEQIEEDESVLTAWIGVSDIKITNTNTGRLGKRECYQYDFTLEMEGNPNTGRLLLIDGGGEFGCYSLMSAINENAKDAKAFKNQRDAIEKSFQVTGTYQTDGYRIRHYDDAGVQFAVQDAYLGKTEESVAGIVVYPKEGVYSEANIWMKVSNFDSDERDLNAVLEKECVYTLENEDNARMLSQPAEIEGGRYPMAGAVLEFYDEGDKYTAKKIVIDCSKERWAVEMKAADEYLKEASAALSDILASFKFTDEGEEGENIISKVDDSVGGSGAGEVDMTKEVIKEIENQPGYTTSRVC